MITSILQADTRLSLRLSVSEIELLLQEIAGQYAYLMCQAEIFGNQPLQSALEFQLLKPIAELVKKARQRAYQSKKCVTLLTMPFAYWMLLHWTIPDQEHIPLRLLMGKIDQMIKSSPLANLYQTRTI